MTRTSEIAKVMVAQGRLSQEQYEQLFGWKIEEEARLKKRTEGARVGTEDTGNREAMPPRRETGIMPPESSEPSPALPVRGGKDAAAGLDSADAPHAEAAPEQSGVLGREEEPPPPTPDSELF